MRKTQSQRGGQPKCIAAFTAAALLSFGCATSLAAEAPLQSTGVAAPQFGSWGIDLSAMDKSVKPGDNFFMFVNGNWYKKTVCVPRT